MTAAQSSVVVCLVCRIDFDVCRHGGEAAYMAAAHNDLHHGSAPVAFLATVHGRAESDGPPGDDAA